ncbi:imelysin family protein [Fulvimarina sp. MAC8]|uniref:imelysin family protein n=1 Tax=Fulvimarina sp. MAC8 TaxID=3162874 RepID=UPI0032EB1722
MRRPNRLAAALLAGLIAAPGAAFAQDTGEGDAPRSATLDDSLALETVASAIDDAIRPGYQAFADATREEALKVETLCSEPSESALSKAKEGFGDLVSAFSGVEFIRFGPIREENRLERILFFPDPRGVTRRQVEQLLAEKDETAAEVETLAQKSVAVQGLPALEFVLFGEGSEALNGSDAAYRCAYGAAISQNLVNMADAITEAWGDDSGIYQRLTAPEADDPAYRSASDSIGELVSVFTDGLEIIRDQRIRPALGEEGNSPKPYLFLVNRSGNALNALKADFAGLKSLFEAAGFAEVLPEEQVYLQDSIGLEFEQIVATLGDIEAPLSETAASEETRGKLDYAMIAARSLRSQFENQLAASLGLSTGFSSLDGD